MAATIHDVAKRAGVSHTTVSWVIHDDARISAETKQKVLRAIQELHYHPNYVARSLVKGRTNTVAVVAAVFSSPFEIEILKGIESGQEGNHGRYERYSISLFHTRGQRRRKNQLLQEILYGRQADAVILLSLKMAPALLKEFSGHGIPVVLVEEKLKGAHVVKTDNEKGAYLAAEYLLRKGRRTIGIVSGNTAVEEAGLSPAERLRGFRAALADAQIPWNEAHAYYVNDYNFEDGQAVWPRIRADLPKLEALFCAAGDMVAIGILDQATRQGLRIPADLALIGYDDVLPAALVRPALTTIKQPIQQLGRTAFELAVQSALGAIAEPREVVFDPVVVERDSV